MLMLGSAEVFSSFQMVDIKNPDGVLMTLANIIYI